MLATQAADYARGAIFHIDETRAMVRNARWYGNPALEAYAWLDSPDPAHRALAEDAVDAVRLVRAADALRQRGTTLRTAAGYDVFIDVETGDRQLDRRHQSEHAEQASGQS